jgi:hypothetical protein
MVNIQCCFLIILLLFSPWLNADTCRLETDEAVEHAKIIITNADMVVTVCSHCEKTGPVPLRIKNVEFRHFAPETVSIPFYEEEFPLTALEEAEQKGTGALAVTLHAKIEKEYEDETGYLPNDPYLIQEKSDRYKMLLRFTRQDYEMKVWDELFINGKPVNPAMIYYPVGRDRYKSLGIEVDCDIYLNAPKQVTYKPVTRDPAKAAPPNIYIADITGQCYDGSCPEPEWTVHTPTPYFDHAEGKQIGIMNDGEILKPLKTQSHVTAARAIATRDHDHIFEGDIFYLLDSQAEGYYRFWHYGNVFIDNADGVLVEGSWDYCKTENICWAEADTQPTSVWWSKVRRQDGEIVWVREPMQTLSGVLVD